MALPLQHVRRVVIKLGTGILTSGIGQLDSARIAAIAEEVARLEARGKEVILVSSGAVGLGMGRLGLKAKPKKLAALQMCAAVGQSCLTEIWQQALEPHRLTAAQLLLTREDVQSRKRHLALVDLLEEILAEGIVPIVNENDSVSADEIKFGDNDVLSALVASLSRAGLLCILSTAQGLEDRSGGGALIPVVEHIGEEHFQMAEGTESPTGTGGMVTKLEAARIATHSGCAVFIGHGGKPGIIEKVFDGRAPGTIFLPRKLPLRARKRWLAFFQPAAGTISIDAGAVRALVERGSSLLAKGVIAAQGDFQNGDVVDLKGPDGELVARGTVRFDQTALQMALGKKSTELKALFPERKHLEVVHRDALVLMS